MNMEIQTLLLLTKQEVTIKSHTIVRVSEVTNCDSVVFGMERV